MVQETDAELVASARCGDKAAFSRLIERYQSIAFHFAQKIVSKLDLAQDLAQEAFLQAYLSLDRLREGDRFQAWLFGIVLNVCRNYIRHQKVTPFSYEEIMGGLKGDTALVTATTSDPMKMAEEQELYSLVLEAVSTLSPKNRDATLLFYFEQFTLYEIATLLGISIAAVKGRLNKSRNQLRDQLSPLFLEKGSTILKLQGDYSMIQVKIADIIPNSDQGDIKSCVVVLWAETSRRFLPIWVGLSSGETIAQILNTTSLPRPMTFQLMASLLNTATVDIESVRIDALRENAYYSTVSMRDGQQVREVDARPSDAIALALQMRRPIYVTQEVMEQQGITVPPEIENLPLGKGLNYFNDKQEEKQKETGKIGQKYKAHMLLEEMASRGQTERYQKMISFLFNEE